MQNSGSPSYIIALNRVILNEVSGYDELAKSGCGVDDWVKFLSLNVNSRGDMVTHVKYVNGNSWVLQA